MDRPMVGEDTSSRAPRINQQNLPITACSQAHTSPIEAEYTSSQQSHAVAYVSRHEDPKVLFQSAAGWLAQFQEQGEGDLQLLNSAVTNFRKVLNAWPSNHPSSLTALRNLATSLRLRFERHGNPQDMMEAIHLHSTISKRLPQNHPLQGSNRSCLADLLTARFRQQGDRQDLDDAIAHRRESLTLRPEGHPDRIISLKNLASSLFTRFEQDGNEQDLQEVIRHHEEVLRLLPEDHLERPSIDAILGLAFRRQRDVQAQLNFLLPLPVMNNPQVERLPEVPIERPFRRHTSIFALFRQARLRALNTVIRMNRTRTQRNETSYERTNHDTNEPSPGERAIESQGWQAPDLHEANRDNPRHSPHCPRSQRQLSYGESFRNAYRNVDDNLQSSASENFASLARDGIGGMEFLNSIPVVHGDIKAANVLVNADGCARISDFGFSRLIEETNEVSDLEAPTNSNNVRSRRRFPIALGSYSDIWRGVWRVSDTVTNSSHKPKADPTFSIPTILHTPATTEMPRKDPFYHKLFMTVVYGILAFVAGEGPRLWLDLIHPRYAFYSINTNLGTQRVFSTPSGWILGELAFFWVALISQAALIIIMEFKILRAFDQGYPYTRSLLFSLYISDTIQAGSTLLADAWIGPSKIGRNGNGRKVSNAQWYPCLFFLMVSPLGIYRFSRSFLKVALGPLSVLLWFMDPFSFGIISRLASYTCAIMAQFNQRQGEMFRSSLLKSLQRVVVTYQSRASPPSTVGISDPKMDSQLCSSCTFCGVAGLFVFRARS